MRFALGSSDFWEAFALSLIPGLFWLAYLRGLFLKRPPVWWWLLALGLGVFSTQVTVFVSEFFGVQELLSMKWGGLFAYYVVGVGMVEELAKALCAVLGLLMVRGFRDPRSAILFCGGVALGFATWENVHYALGYGSGVLVGRGLFSTLGHVVMSAVWGAALARTDRQARWLGVWGALLVASVGHGLYNWFLVTGRTPLAILALIILWSLFRESTNVTAVDTQYHRAVESGRSCACSAESPWQAAFCTRCGRELPPLAEPVQDTLGAALPS